MCSSRALLMIPSSTGIKTNRISTLSAIDSLTVAPVTWSNHCVDERSSPGHAPSRRGPERSRTGPHSTGLQSPGTGRLSWSSGINMRCPKPPRRTRSSGTPATVHMLSSRPGTIQLQFESLRSAPCIPRLPSKSTVHVHHRPCADGTVRQPYPSELTCRGGYLEHLR